MTKSIEKIKNRLETIGEDPFRRHVLETALKFRTSWIELGRSLFSVYKDKKYREWGYQTFEIYIVKEIGIRKQTSMKLLRSYSFLEKEEPQILSHVQHGDVKTHHFPDYESIDILRQAKNKNIDKDDYVSLKEKIFLKGKDAKEIRKDLTTLIREREEMTPQEAFEKKSSVQIRRVISVLKSLSREIETSQIIPHKYIQTIKKLIADISSISQSKEE